jgi:hypothetical protein
MDHPARIALSSSFLVIRVLPSLAIVLAGISVCLVGAGLRDDASPAITAHQVWPPIGARASMTMPIVPRVRPLEDGPRLLVEQWRRPRNGNPDLRGSSGQRSGCLRRDCMWTHRTATPRVLIERPAGNLRVALAAMAIAQRRGPWTTACPCLAMEAMCPKPVPATSEDRIANALFGPGQPGARDSAGQTTAPCRAHAGHHGHDCRYGASIGYGASVPDQMASGSMLSANSTAGSSSPLVMLRRMPGAGARNTDCTPGYWVSGGRGVCSARRR